MPELIDHVDEENNVIGVIDRDVVKQRGLPRRIVHIFVVNSDGDVYFHRTVETKSVFGGHWGSSAVGYVKAGESYEDAARRELAEELGVFGKPLTHLGDLLLDFDGIKRFAGFFLCVHDGEVTPDPREIAEGRFFTREETEALMASGKIWPSLPTLYKHFSSTYL